MGDRKQHAAPAGGRSSILLLEGIGFGIVALAIWLNELFDLPHALFGQPVTGFNWHEAIAETLFVVILAIVIMIVTHRLIRRLSQLEGLLPICTVCKKIRRPNSDPEVQDSWEILERYINERTGSDFSHGLCPACAQKLYGAYLTEESPHDR